MKSHVPVVIALLVVVLSENVPVPVISRIDELPASTREVELNVEAPVPVAKVFEPVIVVLPLRETAPVPVPNVPVHD